MGNPIKYSATVTSGSYNKGNVAIGTNTIGFGPTSTTGWYNSVTPTGGNFIVTEVVDGNTPPRFYAPSSDSEWIRLAKQEGATGVYTGSALAVRNWFASQANFVVTNIDFSTDIPDVVGNGLNLNVFSNIPSSYTGSGTAWNDISGLGNNQTLVNGTTYNSGLKTLVFDGVDDGTYGVVDYDDGLTNEITMEALFYNTNGSADRAILMNKENSYEFGVNNSTGQFQWAIASLGPGWNWWGAGPDVRNKWTHGIVTRDSNGTERSYINGVLTTTQGGTAGNITRYNNRLNIAGRGGGTSPGSNFGGQIANVKRYYKALSQAEILQNYYQAPIVTDGLVFAADAGNLVSYASGSTTTYSLTGSISGSLLNGTGYLNSDGGVWDLDGSDDRIALGYQPTMLTSDITQEAWVKADNMYNWSGIISNMPSWGTGFSLQIGPIQNIAAMVSGVYLKTSWAPKTDVWYHILATHRSSDDLNVLYVNGVQENSFIKSISYSANAVTEIGVFYTGGGLPLDGKIGLVRTYNRALTEAEALQNFNAQRSRFGI
jgi:hypothetical protein